MRFLGWIGIWVGLGAGFALQAGAQGKADRYAGEAVVVERLDSVYHYNADGTGWKLDTDVARLQTEAAVRAFGVLSVPYAAGSQRLEVGYLRVRKANGTVVETPATDAQDQPAPVTQAAPFYSDVHLMQIPVRGLGVGDRLEYQVRTVFVKPEAKDEFWGAESFGKGVVVLERGVELRVPAGKYVEVSSPRFPAKVSEEAGERVYRWTGSQPEPTPKPVAEGQATDVAAKDEDKVPPIAWTTFRSWAAVGDWYRGLARERSAPTPALKAKADELVYGLGTPEAKIRALYGYVSSQVRYISVSLGLGRYQPHAAGDVLANQYGDCKDKHTLLAALLRAEGLPVGTVLIGSGIDVDEAVPAPGWFNHVITLTGAGGGEIWLDTTPEVAPFRMLDASLRDKLALVIPAEGEPVLRRTPAELPFAAFDRFEAVGTLSPDGEMKAHVDVTMRGDEELGYREGLRQVTPAQWDRLTQYFVRAEGFSGDPSNTVADAPDKTDAPLHLGYDYDRKPYGDWENYRIIPMQPVLGLPMSDRKTAPAGEVSFGGRHTETAVSRITLPAGFSADLPAGTHLDTDFAKLDKTYRLEKAGDRQVLVTERTLVWKEDKLPRGEWPAYRKFLDGVGDTEPWVQLTNVSARGAGGHGPPAAGESNPVSAELVRQAVQMFQEKDWAGAERKLDEAKAVNARQAELWSGYGYLAAMSGKLNEAAEDYAKELAGHPEEAKVSRALAGLQLRHTDEAGAVATLRASLAATGGKDEATVTMLAGVQGRSNRAAAEATLRAGLAAMPESEPVKLALGSLLLKEGKTAEGAAMLAGVASGAESALVLNDAAYALGDAELDLPVAEAAARRAIRLLNAESARGETGVESRRALERSALLVATWDTYGWILYREGSASEAELWLRAAWMDGAGAVPGMHYAAVLRKVGKAAEAERVSAKAGGTAVGKAEGDGRVFPLARPAGGVAGAAGTAVFEMDYSLSGPVVARFVQGEQALAGMGAAVAKVDTGTVLPPGSQAHLLRRGVLRCEAGASCTLRMLPAGAVAGVE